MVEGVIAYYNERRHYPSLGHRTPLSFTNDFLTSHINPIEVVS